MAAFGLSGCGTDTPPAPSPPAAVTTTIPAAPDELPQPSALLDVLNRLADPTVPGTDKITLIETADEADAVALDDFTTAVRDNQMAPLAFSVTHIAHSQSTPGYLVADVTVTPAEPSAAAPFAYPMEFKPAAGGWQLSRQTADLLLEFGR